MCSCCAESEISMGIIQRERRGEIEILTLHRPEALNALNSAELQELEDTIDAIDLEAVRVVILTGAGDKAFVAGADIAQMKDLGETEARTYAELGHRIMRKLETLPVPVIAAVNGYALGGGNELAMSCDIRYASENAIFGQPEVGLGITPGFGGTQRLARLIGSRSKANEMLLSGRTINAEEALRIGLVSAVFPQQELMAQAMKLAETIAKNAPIAVRKTKAALQKGMDLPLEEGLKGEVDAFANCFTTHDQVEGMTAFLEKRKEKHFTNQ